MVNRTMRLIAVLVALVSLSGARAQNTQPKMHLLSPTEERKWVNAVKTHRTEDGATVEEVLRFAEKMRPKEFKSGQMGVGYNGGSGEPDSVGIDYWIGAKRLKDDAIVNWPTTSTRLAPGWKSDLWVADFGSVRERQGRLLASHR